MPNSNPFISPLAHVINTSLGENSKVWHFCNLYDCTVGRDTQIGSFSEIRKGATVGDHCRIQSYVHIPESCRVGNFVFLGPGVILTNDASPSALKAKSGQWKLEPVIIEDHAVVGAGCVIAPGVVIGTKSFIGAGSLVLQNTEPYGVYYGHPAVKKGDLRDKKFAGRFPEIVNREPAPPSP